MRVLGEGCWALQSWRPYSTSVGALGSPVTGALCGRLLGGCRQQGAVRIHTPCRCAALGTARGLRWLLRAAATAIAVLLLPSTCRRRRQAQPSPGDLGQGYAGVVPPNAGRPAAAERARLVRNAAAEALASIVLLARLALIAAAGHSVQERSPGSRQQWGSAGQAIQAPQGAMAAA